MRRMPDDENEEMPRDFVAGLLLLDALSSILSMEDDYDDRLIENYSSADGRYVVDTCAVRDSDHPYETALKHPSYNDGNWIVVENYDDPISAKDGHDKWVSLLLEHNLPYQLTDVSGHKLAALADIFYQDQWREQKRNAWIDDGDNEDGWSL